MTASPTLRLLRIGARAAGARFLGKRYPLAVSWLITGRCTNRCRYCAIWRDPPDELTTREALGILDELAALGTERVHFGGGDPLLREDIGLLIGRCRELGITPALNTNGALVPRMIESLTPLACLNVSLDGPEESHDAVRGAGSHRQALAAAQAARAAGLPVMLLCTVTSVNAGSLSYVVDVAERLGATAQFQPATAHLLAGAEINPVAPLPADMRTAVDTLLSLKQRGKPVANSVPGLRHLRPWPELGRLPCAGARLFCVIDPAGYVNRCSESNVRAERNNIRTAGFAAAFRQVETVAGCDRCECASVVEINLSFSLNPLAIRGMLGSL